jgi:hypothetical protein
MAVKGKFFFSLYGTNKKEFCFAFIANDAPNKNIF